MRFDAGLECRTPILQTRLDGLFSSKLKAANSQGIRDCSRGETL